MLQNAEQIAYHKISNYSRHDHTKDIGKSKRHTHLWRGKLSKLQKKRA